MLEQAQTQTTLTKCPDCGQGIRIKGEILLCMPVTCPNCGVQLQVIGTSPLELDWVYEEWDVDDLDW